MDWVVLGQQLWYGLVNGGTYVIFASGLTLIFGMMKVANIAHGELYMLGAMLVYSLMAFLGLNFYLAAGLSIVLAGAFGIIFNRAVIQPLLATPLSVFLSTMAVGTIMLHGGVAIWGSDVNRVTTPFTGVIDVGGVKITEQSIVLVVVAVTAMVLLHLFLTKSGLGKIMRATSQNIIGAKLVGINVTRVFDYTMILAAGLAALAGILKAPITCAHPYMGQPMLLMGFAVVIMGGMGNIRNTIVVGLLLGLLEALFAQYVDPYYRIVFIYGLMIVVLILKPEGLFALFARKEG